jgi:hypothetical protein
MTMRRGHHTSSVLKAMGAVPAQPETESVEHFENSVAAEPE